MVELRKSALLYFGGTGISPISSRLRFSACFGVRRCGSFSGSSTRASRAASARCSSQVRSHRARFFNPEGL